jgi:hypothetical protein
MRPSAKGIAMPASPRPSRRFAFSPLGRTLGIGAAIALLFILLGCMSISIGRFSSTGSTTADDGTFCQEGEVTVPGNCVREVYFPVPYAHPPNLEVSDTFNHGELLEQKEGSFKVRNSSAFSLTITWKARGIKVGAVPIAPLPPVPIEPPLPPAPVPVDAPLDSTGKAR